MIRSARVAVAAISLAASSAWSVPCPSGVPYRFLRYDEDYRYLRDLACRSDLFDPLKFIALDDAGERFITLGGDARLKLVNTRHVVIGDEPGDNHNVAVQRYHVHANVRATRALRLFGELKANVVSGREPGPRPTDVDRGDVHQLFADVDFGAAMLRVGRQELVYGAGRRIFPRNGTNVRGSYDAVRLATRAGDWRADAFALSPVEIDRTGHFDDGRIHAETAGGVYVVGSPAGLRPLNLDIYWIASRREGARFVQGVATDDRHSFGTRLAGRQGSWDTDVEATYQTGTFGAGKIRAWAVTGDVGYRFVAPLPMRVAFRASAASGDRDPATADLQTFHSLYPAGPTLDEFFSISTANVVFARPWIEVEVTPYLRARFDIAWILRQSDRDTVYGGGGQSLRAPGTSRSRDVGRNGGLKLQWTASRHFSVDFFAGVFQPGAFVRDTGPARRAWVVTTYFNYRF